MSLYNSIILGFVEGFTEFLPISSTAHLVLTSKLLGIETSDFLKSFEIVIQLGAVLAVVLLYFKTFLKDWATNRKIVIAFIPTAIFGLIFYDFVKDSFLVNPSVSTYALLFGGIFILFFESFFKEKTHHINNLQDISYLKSFIIGCAQSISIIPGVSRAAATILGGLALGINRRTIVEFSFLLAVPTMLGASILDLSKSYTIFNSADWISLAIGFTTSFVVALFGIKFFLNYVQTRNFKPFGIYRIILALIILSLL